MTMKRLIAAGLLLLAPALPAHAQTMIQPGQTIEGQVTEASPEYKGRRYACHELETTPGSRWVIDLSAAYYDPIIFLGRGSDCAHATWDFYGDGFDGPIIKTNPKIRFIAGGGRYLIMAYSNVGAYKLSVRQDTGTPPRDVMPPGLVISPLRVGTASTVEGPTPQETHGQALRDCADCPEMTVIRAGSFMMGSPASEEGRQASEGPRHLVTIGRAFAIGKYEVTFDQYDACVADRHCAPVPDQEWGRGRRPVINVSYRDASLYVAWLSEKTGQAYFLPSESEWEYAARAGTDTPWNTGTALLADEANIMDQFAKTANVGGYPPNAWGLYDTHGNVGEWVQDCMDTGYLGASDDGRVAVNGDCAAQRLTRDNAWNADPYKVRSASRNPVPAHLRYRGIGFRVARAL
ncbi:formylglycine-generating enzyme family protein [Brevundimonas faecalis]|uniref:formylglycine-generating enzyme family protein n=1 Tax=Brevundimonas faecalis TaxID=947378 RepID=UPI00361BADD6